VKIYLAAPYGEMQRMHDWASRLEAVGHTITARWIYGNEEGMTLHDAAQMDIDDVDAADAVVSMVLPKGTLFSSGGRHVEFGYGFARNKLMIIVSDHAENIFHEHGSVVKCPALLDVIDYLKGRT
jgi:hypothetical protein